MVRGGAFSHWARCLTASRAISFFWIAGDRAAEGLGIVGVDMCIETWAGDRHIELLVVDEACAAHRVIVHDQAVNGGCLEEGCHAVAVIQVGMAEKG